MTLQLMRWVWEDNAAYFEYRRKTNTCFFRITIALCHFEAQILLVSYTKAESSLTSPLFLDHISFIIKFRRFSHASLLLDQQQSDYK